MILNQIIIKKSDPLLPRLKSMFPTATESLNMV